MNIRKTHIGLIYVLRYQPRNLLLTGIVPGPKEPTADELQHALRIITDEKERLYRDGFVVPTPRFPQGMLSTILHIPNSDCLNCKGDLFESPV